jgi:hypothetical protein
MQFGRLQRREFVTLVGGAAATWPMVALAQQGSMPIIGLLSSRSAAVDAPLINIVRRGLGESGFVEGRNVAFDYRTSDGRYDRMAEFAADLVRRQVSLILTTHRHWQPRPRRQAFRSSSSSAMTRFAAASSPAFIVRVAM